MFIGDRLGLDVAVDPRLRERMSWEDEQRQSLEEFLAEWDAASRNRSLVPMSGDSSRDAAARFLTAIEELARSTDDGADAIVVAHGGVTVDALRTLLGDERLRRQQADLIERGVPNCAITALCWDHRGWRVQLPSTAHLHG
jgi:broad specificity phosphatase PhoE